jgi:hypothetical protein
LCNRRSWAEPEFDSRCTRQGWVSCVRVNNREYNADGAFQTEKLAREKAAEAAYFICYNFSVNDGLPPGQRAGQAGVTQGLPVAIGTGRRTSSSSGSSSSSSSSGERHRRSGGGRGSGRRHAEHHSSASTSASQAASRAAAAAAAFAAAGRADTASVSDEGSEYEYQHSAGGSAALAAVAAGQYAYINHPEAEKGAQVLCACGRCYTPQYSPCGYCLREAGYY